MLPSSLKTIQDAKRIPVSTAIIDAHAGVPGAGVATPGTLVMVLGTSACHMINATTEHLVPGVAGVVADGILPGFFGYETGQASVGDAFAWLVDTFKLSHEEMTKRAAELPPGSGGVMALDWLNGCRTPLMDGRLSGSFVGISDGQINRLVILLSQRLAKIGKRGLHLAHLLREGLKGTPHLRGPGNGGRPLKYHKHEESYDSGHACRRHRAHGFHDQAASAWGYFAGHGGARARKSDVSQSPLPFNDE